MISFVDLSEWKKLKDIKFELHRDYGIDISRDGREWRTAVERWNEAFINGNVDTYITHSTKGFKATKDYNEAKLARNDYLKRAFNMIKKARNCDKAFNHLSNYKIDFEKGEII